MSSIFISHSSRDDAIAAEIAERLSAEGHRSIFLDFDPADGIPARWPELFLHSIHLDAMLTSVMSLSDDLMVAVLRSPQGVEMRWVLDGRWTVPLDHPAPVYLAVVEGETDEAARGRWALTAAEDGAVRLWALPKLRPLIVAMLEEGDLAELNRMLAPGTQAQVARKASLISVFDGHRERVSVLGLSLDGEHAVSVAGDEAAIWRLAAGAEPVVLRGHDDSITSATFSPDGRRLATTSKDRRALVYDLSDLLAPLLVLDDHDAAVACAAFDPQATEILTVTEARQVRRWRAGGGGAKVATIDCDPVQVRYTETAGQAVIACNDGTARLVDLSSGRSAVFR